MGKCSDMALVVLRFENETQTIMVNFQMVIPQPGKFRESIYGFRHVKRVIEGVKHVDC
jgi:hypothetical protein